MNNLETNMLTFNREEILKSPFLLDQETISSYNLGLPSFIDLDGELKIIPFPKTEIYKIFKITRKTKNLIIKITTNQRIVRLTKFHFIVLNKNKRLIQTELKGKITTLVNILIESLRDFKNSL